MIVLASGRAPSLRGMNLAPLPEALRRTPRVVVINGPAGVGKTTTARALAKRAGNGACIHGDVLRDFVVARRDGTVQQGLGYRNGAAIAGNFIDSGYELVVFEYVFESPRALEHFRRAYTSSAPVHFFTLWAPLEVVKARENGRPGRAPLGRRLSECWHAVDRNLGDLGVVVNTDGCQVEDVVSDLLVRTGRGDGLIRTSADARRELALAS